MTDQQEMATARPDTEWTDGASTPTAEDYRELQAQYDQLQSKYKAAMDTLGSAVKTAEFEGHANRSWRDYAKALLADNAPMPEPVLVVPEGWQLVPVKPTEEMITASVMKRMGASSMEELDCNAGVWAARDCLTYYLAMLAAAPKPEAKP